MARDQTKKIINQFKQPINTLKPQAQMQVPIATDMFLPNLSGDHTAGRMLRTPENDYDIANKKYVDDMLGVNVTVSKATFDITSNTSVISAAGAGIKNKIVAISIHNNDTTGTNDTVVKITDGNGGTVLVGGTTGAVYLVGRGGFWGLPMNVTHPWFETTANTALYINPVSSKRVSGAVWYIQEE